MEAASIFHPKLYSSLALFTEKVSRGTQRTAIIIAVLLMTVWGGEIL